MRIDEIKYASFDDIVFDGRNKEYGAYELRNKFGKRLAIATAITIILVALLLGSFALTKFFEKAETEKGKIEITEVDLADVNVNEPKKNTPPPPPPQPKDIPPPPKQSTVQYTTPKIVDEPKNPMKEQSKINDDNIDKKDQEGDKDAKPDPPPPTDKGEGFKEIPDSDGDGFKDNVDKCPSDPGPDNGCPRKVDPNTLQTKTDTKAIYPGGDGAWNAFLSRTIEYPEEDAENGTQGVVILRFEVDPNGNISNVQAMSGPSASLKAEAIRAIKKSGKWTPATIAGQNVRAYGTQKVTFRLVE